MLPTADGDGLTIQPPGITTFDQAITAGDTSTDEALAIFDGLETVDADFMLGAWRGDGFPTQHRLDGVLETYHWHGKRFESQERVHPLVFTTITGGTVNVNPALAPLGLINRLPVPKTAVMGRLFQLCLPLLCTRRPRARLRMIEHRGRVTAAMLYDDLPINDVFRKVDDNTLLGIMDLKGMTQPLFFVLRRA